MRKNSSIDKVGPNAKFFALYFTVIIQTSIIQSSCSYWVYFYIKCIQEPPYSGINHLLLVRTRCVCGYRCSFIEFSLKSDSHLAKLVLFTSMKAPYKWWKRFLFHFRSFLLSSFLFLFGHARKQLDKKTNFLFKTWYIINAKEIITKHILHNITRSKGKQTMSDIYFLKNHGENRQVDHSMTSFRFLRKLYMTWKQMDNTLISI